MVLSAGSVTFPNLCPPGAPAAEEYGAPADESYGAPAYDDYSEGSGSGDDYDYEASGADDSYGAPADDSYGKMSSHVTSDIFIHHRDITGAPAEESYGAPPTYEEDAAAEVRRGRGRFGNNRQAPRRPATRSRTPARRPSANRRPAARRPAQAARAGRQFRQKAAGRRPAGNRRRPAGRQQPQQPRRGRGLIPIPIPHRGPRRNAIAFRQPSHGK